MSNSTPQRGFLIRAISLVAIGFGLLTIKEGGMTLSGDAAARSLDPAIGGWDAFVPKPCMPDGLVSAVRGVLEARGRH